MEYCRFCIHEKKLSSQFPCNDCSVMGNGDEDMFVGKDASIKDSGNRTEFSTGAVRDIQEGKGRCDLMPLDVIGEVLAGGHGAIDTVIHDIALFTKTGDFKNLYYALLCFDGFDTTQTMLLEVAKHFEEGAKKYGENNWQKGIPLPRYIDSAVRHYLKYLRGDKDEPHDRAFVWNIICAIWTCMHKPELNDYAKEKNDAED